MVFGGALLVGVLGALLVDVLDEGVYELVLGPGYYYGSWVCGG